MRLGIFVVVLLVFVLAVPGVLAAEGVPEGLLDDVSITFGAVTVLWLSVQRGIIQLLKGFRLRGRPLLPTPKSIWIANGVLAVAGLSVAALQSGQPFLASVIQSVLAFLAASGLHEFSTNLGNEDTENVPIGT